jgi:predicted nucleotide-binding protein (sugar kinase/HSP70/actin superfamily)
MLVAKIKNAVQRSDEHKLLKPFEADFHGYEEPEVEEILDYSDRYLPCPPGAGGEMVLNIGRTIFLYEKGVDGVVDISPFTCMNGIVSEALYPRVSRDHEDIPIRTFYFDGTQLDLERDIGIFIELARNYKRKETKKRESEK